MNQDCPRKKVVIEDLIRLKRAERPPAEFWNRFERELRAKQLAAIVEKRPWWRSLPRGVWGPARGYAPLGAAAILVLSFLTVREYRGPAADRHSVASVVADVSPTPIAGVLPASVMSKSAEDIVNTTFELPDTGAVDDGLDIARTVPGFAPVRAEADAVAAPATLAGPEMLASLSDTRTADANLVAALSGGSGFESRALPSRSQVMEPLAQLATPKSVRLRDRYLGGAFPAAYSLDSSAASPGRVVNRLRDRQLRPEEFSRFDARGNSLSIKL